METQNTAGKPRSMPTEQHHGMRPRPTWNNSRHWPTCHKSQDEAGIPSGPFQERPEPMTRWQNFCFGVLMGLLLIGPALADLWSVL